MTDYTKIHDDCMREMFRRVGEDFDTPDWQAAICEDGWYRLKEWTETEETSFKEWMTTYLRKYIKHLPKRKIDSEVGMFMLNYGWRVNAKT